ncbi:MAG: GHKL domain-containing protein [Oscillospiraceae bacterium]|nr:GHKL domain-containing protein [Oscillospiraceae bacterium]
MIKKLRRRLIWVIMAVISLIMLIFMGAIYAYMHTSEEKSSDMTLTMAFDERIGVFGGADRESRTPQSVPEKPPEERESDSGDDDGAERQRRRMETELRREQISFGSNNDLSQLLRTGSPMNSGWIRVKIEDGKPEDVFFSQNRSRSEDEEEQRVEDAFEIAERVIAKGSSSGRLNAYGTHYKYRLKNDTLVLLDVTQSDATMARLLIVLLIIFLISLAVFFTLAVFLSKWVSVPIEDAWKRQNEFFSDASHELKTPLAVISANLDVMRSGDLSGDDAEKFYSIIHEETDKMSGLISRMLYLSREEYTENTVMTDVDLSYETESACLSLEALAFEQGKSLESSIAEGITVKGDKASLCRVIHILTDNAIKHSSKGSVINVELDKYKGRARLRISNDGEISPEELSHIFDRFYRTDRSRNRETGGYGLGLAIAKAITERHKGSLTAESAKGRVTFTALF